MSFKTSCGPGKGMSQSLRRILSGLPRVKLSQRSRNKQLAHNRRHKLRRWDESSGFNLVASGLRCNPMIWHQLIATPCRAVSVKMSSIRFLQAYRSNTRAGNYYLCPSARKIEEARLAEGPPCRFHQSYRTCTTWTFSTWCDDWVSAANCLLSPSRDHTSCLSYPS